MSRVSTGRKEILDEGDGELEDAEVGKCREFLENYVVCLI